MLYIMAGLSGTGKTTLARHLARIRSAMHLRIDSIEQAMRDEGMIPSGPEGYVVAHRIAADNLRLGMSVIADSVNPWLITRAAWREVANLARAPYLEIEVICSDAAEHRARVERRATDIPNLVLPTWDEVLARKYEAWDTSPLVIDTAGKTVEESVAALSRALTSHPTVNDHGTVTT